MSERKVHRRPRAVDDLEALSGYLYDEGGVELGIRFLDPAELAFDQLLQMPGLGAERSGLSARLPALRIWPIPGFPNHLVFYQPVEYGIEIIRVLHGARDVPQVLDDG